MADAKKRATAASDKTTGAKRKVIKQLPLAEEKLGNVKGGAIAVGGGLSPTPTRPTLT